LTTRTRTSVVVGDVPAVYLINRVKEGRHPATRCRRGRFIKGPSCPKNGASLLQSGRIGLVSIEKSHNTHSGLTG